MAIAAPAAPPMANAKIPLFHLKAFYNSTTFGITAFLSVEGADRDQATGLVDHTYGHIVAKSPSAILVESPFRVFSTRSAASVIDCKCSTASSIGIRLLAGSSAFSS
jgi:hypothetical protein